MHAPLYASHRNKRMDQWLKMLSEGAPFEPAIVWYYSPRITSRAVASSLHLVWANVGLGRPPSAARTRRISSARAAILQNGEHLGLVMPSKGRTVGCYGDRLLPKDRAKTFGTGHVRLDL